MSCGGSEIIDSDGKLEDEEECCSPTLRPGALKETSKISG